MLALLQVVNVLSITKIVNYLETICLKQLVNVQ